MKEGIHISGPRDFRNMKGMIFEYISVQKIQSIRRKKKKSSSVVPNKGNYSLLLKSKKRSVDVDKRKRQKKESKKNDKKKKKKIAKDSSVIKSKFKKSEQTGKKRSKLCILGQL